MIHFISAISFIQLFRDAPTTELPLSMLSNNEGGLTATELAVKIGAANSPCKISLFG